MTAAALEVSIARLVMRVHAGRLDDDANVRDGARRVVERKAAARAQELAERLRVAGVLDEERDRRVRGVELVALRLRGRRNRERARDDDGNAETKHRESHGAHCTGRC